MLPGPPPLHSFVSMVVILSITLCAGGAAAFNMWYDRDIDAIMTRTRSRPIPSGHIHPNDALVFALILCIVGVMLMYLATPHATPYLIFSIFFYTIIYTICLKRFTDQNIVIGGAAGAFPPLIAWVAVTGHLTIQAIILFWIIFIWTPSHFWALSIYKNDDYRLANIPMLPLTKGVPYTATSIMVYSVALVISSYLPLYCNLGAAIYGVGVTVINLPYLMYAWTLKQTLQSDHAIRLFKYSIFYLFALYALLLINKIYHHSSFF